MKRLIAFVLGLSLFQRAAAMRPIDEQLLKAANNNYLTGVIKAITNGANIYIKNKYDNTALEFAALARNKPLTEALIEKGALKSKDSKFNTDQENMLSYYAAGNNWLDMLKISIKHGVDINAQQYENGYTLLHYAIPILYSKKNKEERNKTALWLIENGANIYIKNKSGDTVLKCAALGWNTMLVKALLNKGALRSKDAKFNKEQATMLLHYAIRNDWFDIAKVAVEHGADIHAQDENGKTALDKAVKHQNKELARHMLYTMDTKALTNAQKNYPSLKQSIQEVEKNQWNQDYFAVWCWRDLRSGNYAHILKVFENEKNKKIIESHVTYPLLYTIFHLVRNNKILPHEARAILLGAPTKQEKIEIVRNARRIGKQLESPRLQTDITNALYLIAREIKKPLSLPLEIRNLIAWNLVYRTQLPLKLAETHSKHYS